jgi:hypothetical protein
MLLHMLGWAIGCCIGAVGAGETACEGAGALGWGEVVVLVPRLPEEERPPPALAKTSSGMRKQRKKNSVKSISPFNTQRFVDITPPNLVYLVYFVFLVCLVLLMPLTIISLALVKAPFP